MKIWIISDTHFYHGNIIKYCNRPFDNYKDMNEQLIAKWNAKVAKEDLVIHLGDFCFFGKEKIIEIRNKLNGQIILLKGSHDAQVDNECGMILVEGKIVIGNLILTHEPMQDIPIGFTNIHGHIHHHDSYFGINISVEKTNYEPIELNSLLNK